MLGKENLGFAKLTGASCRELARRFGAVEIALYPLQWRQVR
jgi:hypothetical protein